MADMIPTFAGTPYEVGRALGETYRDPILAGYDQTREGLSRAKSTREIQTTLLSGWYLTEKHLPAIAEELKGVADGAGLRHLALFLTWYEELLDVDELGGCTDIVASGEATRDGRALLGHNNDLDPSAGTMLVFRLSVEGQPAILSFAHNGVAPSAGMNAAGVVCSGNTLTNSDIRWGGIPRLVLLRAALCARTIEDALRISTNPLRASSYNNVFADDRGRIIDEEGSATSAAWRSPTEGDGLLSHSNHYVIPEMTPYEAKRTDLPSTWLRKDRSRQLLEQFRGQHTTGTFRRILSDHVGRDQGASICLHEDGRTVFSIIVEPERHLVWYCEGNPCEGEYEPITY